jgi:FMN phosphatase YigB (HAD superfamily)
MITTVVFDFAGVLGMRVMPLFAARLEQELGIPPDLLLRTWDRYNQRVDRGAMPIHEFWNHIRNDLAISKDYPAEEIFLEYILLDPQMLALARKLKDHYAIGLLSNIYETAGERIKSLPELDGLLDIRVLSYEVGEVKPEPIKERYDEEDLRIYAILEDGLRKKGIKIPSRGSIIFIDDKEGPYRSARQYGLAAIRHDGDMEKLEAALREHGVRV